MRKKLKQKEPDEVKLRFELELLKNGCTFIDVKCSDGRIKSFYSNGKITVSKVYHQSYSDINAVKSIQQDQKKIAKALGLPSTKRELNMKYSLMR